MPGDNARAQDKARTLPADCILFDLEDAVGPAQKEQARARVAESLRAGGYGARELAVRVNALDTPWGEQDVRAFAHLPIDAIVLPKVQSPEEVSAVGGLLDTLGAPQSLRLWCMIETPLGVLRVAAIAASGGRLQALIAGTSDLTKDLRALHTRERTPLLYSLSSIVVAARAHQLVALDGVHLALDDAEGFDFACQQGRQLGFDGKTLIHPRQLDAANRHFAPTASELTAARRIVEAYDAAIAAGRGVALLDGRLIESLHVEEARRILALSAAIEVQSSSRGAPA